MQIKLISTEKVNLEEIIKNQVSEILPLYTNKVKKGEVYPDLKSLYERTMIDVTSRYSKNQQEACKLLGMSKSTLWRKKINYGIE